MRNNITLISKDSELFNEIQEICKGSHDVFLNQTAEEGLNSEIVFLDIDTVGIKYLKNLREDSLVIIVTREKGSRYMIESMTFGAFDCVSIPLDDKEVILRIVERATNIKSEITSNLIEYSGDVRGSGVACAIVGNSPMLQEVCKLIGQMGRVDVPVLITGESGTGKDLVAESIWKVSTRWERPFVTINCAAIPEPLLEAELFGYEKGAFTGATTSRTGKFEEANNGVIFLDEIGDMSLSLQAKILRVLQNGSFQRLGDNKDIVVDLRIIAATNKDLKKLVREGKFREDLYFRINVVKLELPSLRERKQDIPLLTECFIRRYCSQMGKEIKGVTNEFIEKLVSHEWPGNVRELENTVRKAIAFTKTDYLTSYDIDFGDSPALGDEQVREDFEEGIRNSVEKLIDSKDSTNIYKELIRDAESILLQETINKCNGNRSKASRMLGINRVTLTRKLKEYDIN